MAERMCLRCNSVILDSDICEDNVEFWVCPKCEKKNYKYKSWGYIAVGGSSKKYMVRKKSRDLCGNVSIIQKEKDGWTHEVIDDEGKVIHEKHKK
jgi:hypothetical protein